MKTQRKKTINRMTIREIRKTPGRFFAIFAIIALGVGFFSGLRIATPLMVRTVDDFYREHRFYDYRILSTLGFEEADLEALRLEQDAAFAEGGWQYDALITNGTGDDAVFKIYSISEQTNLLRLKEGRMPEKPDECLIDAGNRMSLRAGDRIFLSSSNDDDTLDAIGTGGWTVVGFADSPLYINFERGTTSIGNGTVTGFLYAPKEAFTEDYYTEAYIVLKDQGEIFSDRYGTRMDAIRNHWEGAVQDAADARYVRLVADAEEELADAKAEFDDKKADGEKELSDARDELTDGKQELDDARGELTDGRQELEDAWQELEDGRAELEDAAAELRDAKAELESAKDELDRGRKELDDAARELAEGKKQLDDSAEQLAASHDELAAAGETLAENKTVLDGTRTQLEEARQELGQAAAAIAQMKAQLAVMDPAGAEYAMLAAYCAEAETQYETGLAQYEAGLAQYEAGLAQYEAGKAAYEAGLAQYNEGLAQYQGAAAAYESGLREYRAGVEKYEKGKAAYESGRAEYEKGLREYEDGKKKYEDGLAEYEDAVKEYNDGAAEYEDGLMEYRDGLAEYRDGRETFDREVADAEEKIADAEKELADLERPDSYLLERNTNIGYACFENDSSIVRQIARVFPVFFILVAVLVCMTTMTRMVEEQRGQIGVLKGLGYSERDVFRTFAVYAGSAALLGCVFGYALGIWLFPTVIWHAYKIMYIDIPLEIFPDWKLALIVLAVSLVCSVGTTYMTLRRELSESAASLLRPRAPKAGKRVFLEYIPALWNRMRFMHKISARNILRYKKRFFMMITGISGCTALLLTGFGIKDSIASFAETQYGEIQVADADLVFENGKGDEMPEEIRGILSDLGARAMVYTGNTWDLLTEDAVKSVNVIAPRQTEEIDDFFRLRDEGGNALAPPIKGEALISVSLAERYRIKEGDTVTLRNDDMKKMSARVTGVFKNYVYNYVILAPETIEEATGEADANGAYILFPEGADPYEAQTRLAAADDVSHVNVFREFRNRLTKMMSSLDYIVVVVILSAAGLALVVLYNLTNINILERIREIATIKVLGFYRKETAQYVFRENLVLTTIGAALGLFLGIALHRFVMRQIVVDMVYFDVTIRRVSFLWSVLLTFAFTILVNQFMSFRIEKINMAESLKSVE